MARDAKKVTIDEHTYEVQPLQATHAWRVMHQLAAAVAPAVGQLSAMESAGLGAAATSFFDRLTEEQSTALMQKVLHGAKVDGRILSHEFEEHFSGRPGALLELVVFALEANGFFDVVRRMGTRIATKTPVPAVTT